MTDRPLESTLLTPMRIQWDVPITMDDGLVLRADVFLPVEDGAYPVILSYGPYAKGLHFEDGYPSAWNAMLTRKPEVGENSTSILQSWEVADPEKWVNHGYALVRVDSRGAGRSPGLLEPLAPRETKDLGNCIEWAGTQGWSNGRVGLSGVSYYAINAWLAATEQPAHLAAICAWEGMADFYRDSAYHGGILCTFWDNWYSMQTKKVQHGVGSRAWRSRANGTLVAGDVDLTDRELEANRVDFGQQIRNHPFATAWHDERSADWSRVEVPLLSAANLGGQGLHARGNYEAFMRAASEHKYLEIHGLEHWTEYYTDYGIALQRRFFDRFLKGDETAWVDEPRVRIQVRHVDGTFVERGEGAWPIPRTRWTELELDAASRTLDASAPAPASVTYDAWESGPDAGVTFRTAPFAQETEMTGPLAAKLFVSSSTSDADLFLVVRVTDPDGHEVTFQGHSDPHTPIAQGWLRVSHRALDPERSLPYRPYHPHDDKEPITPGEVVEVDVEIWPTSIVIPAGYTLALTVRGTDYVYPHLDGDQPRLSNFANALTGCGPFLHDDPRDRPQEVYGGDVTVHTGGPHRSYLLAPFIPAA
jgi:uncharacterized protein